jgi:hypothetical protein
MSDQLLLRVLIRLLRVRDQLGEAAFAEAVHRSLIAIARSVHDQACHEARTGEIVPKSDVIQFPLVRRHDLEAGSKDIS